MPYRDMPESVSHLSNSPLVGGNEIKGSLVLLRGSRILVCKAFIPD